jgi:hypothetical protein
VVVVFGAAGLLLLEHAAMKVANTTSTGSRGSPSHVRHAAECISDRRPGRADCPYPHRSRAVGF